MTRAASLYFDYVDPLSFAALCVSREAPTPTHVLPFEVVPPPGRLLDPASEAFREKRALAQELGAGLPSEAPFLVPWTRKAHELTLHAREGGTEAELRDTILRAYHLEGRDIGRIDVLVGLAVTVGLDRSEARAVLDVDRYTAEVVSLRAEAERLGVQRVPTLLDEGSLIEGAAAVRRVAGPSEA